MIRITALSLAVIVSLAPRVGNAIPFEFSWHGDPARDPSIVSSTDSTLRAFGTIEIDVAPGEAFALADISRTAINVSGDSIVDFLFGTWIEAGGTVSADGTRAFFSGAGNPYSQESVETFFGCRSPGCEFNFAIDVTRTAPSTAIGQVVYGSAAEALASMQLRAVTIAEPGRNGLVLLAGIALFAAGRLRLSAPGNRIR